MDSSKDAKSKLKRKFKTVFSSPFAATAWPSVSAEHQTYLTELLTRTFAELGRVRRQSEAADNARRGRVRKVLRQDPEHTKRPAQQRRDEVQEVLQSTANGNNTNNNADNGRAARAFDAKGLRFGFNACTRALEQARLKLLVVCRDTKPPILVQHFPVLCYRSNCVLLPLSQGSVVLPDIFGFKRLSVFGIERDCELYDEFASQCFEVVPAVSMPWVTKLPALNVDKASVPAELSLLPAAYRLMSTTEPVKQDRKQRQEHAEANRKRNNHNDDGVSLPSFKKKKP